MGSFSKIHAVAFSSHKTFKWTFPYSIWVVCFHTAAHSAMVSHVIIVCSSSYIYLWFHLLVRPKNAQNHLLIYFRVDLPWMNGVRMCMRSEHCRGPVFKQFTFPLTLDSKAIDRPFIKWWKWNVSQSGLFYGRDRKYWGERRQEKGAFYNRLTTWSIFPVFQVIT